MSYLEKSSNESLEKRVKERSFKRFLPSFTALTVAVGLTAASYLIYPAQIYPQVIDCSGKKFKFDDGDTIYCSGEPIRILGMDTPETRHPEHGIFINQPYENPTEHSKSAGEEAAEYAKSVFEQVSEITVLATGKDKYKRTLGYVLVDGELYASIIIEAGFAYETISKYGDNGFPGLAGLITDAWKIAWKDGEKPSFQNPHEWRKENQVKEKSGCGN